MQRREFLKTTGAVGAGLAAGLPHKDAGAQSAPKKNGSMRAGFARVKITPPLGTTMMGFGGRDMEHGCDDVHDDIYVRALFLEQGGEQALILAYDLCFVGREETDRYRGAIGRRIDLSPRQIMLNTSHNHVGPAVGRWYSAGYEPPDVRYLDQLERATVEAAVQAHRDLREVTLWAGVTESALPVNRRRKNEDGRTENRPNPGGLAYDRLPICLLRDEAGETVCLLFSVSAHPSMMSGWSISAEYPGVAMRLLDEHLGGPASLFLQGVGGDAKPLSIGRSADSRWQRGTWELMEEAGGMVAKETVAALGSLKEVAPQLRAATTEMRWALEPAPPASHFEEMVKGIAPEAQAKNVRYLWAKSVLEQLERGETLTTEVPISLQGIQLGEGLRMVGIEGEATAPWGYFIDEFFGGGTTFSLGYCNGTGMYLPNSAMLPEGGYEVISYWEYGYPSPLAPGMEDVVRQGLERLRESGIA